MRPGFGVERVAVTTCQSISKKFRDHRVARIFRGRADLPLQNRMRMARSARGFTLTAATHAIQQVCEKKNLGVNFYQNGLFFRDIQAF